MPATIGIKMLAASHGQFASENSAPGSFLGLLHSVSSGQGMK